MKSPFTKVLALPILMLAACSSPNGEKMNTSHDVAVKPDTAQPDSNVVKKPDTQNSEVEDANVSSSTIDSLIKAGREIQLIWEKPDQTYEFYFPGMHFGLDSTMHKIVRAEEWALGTKGLIKSKATIDSVTGLEYIDGFHTGHQLSTPDSIICWITKGAHESIEYANMVVSSRLDEEDKSTEGHSHYQIKFRNKEFEFEVIESFRKSGMIEFRDGQPFRVFRTENDHGENDVFYGIRQIVWAGDIDNDGNLDLLLEQGGYCDPDHILFKSDENGDFKSFLHPDNKGEPCGC